MRMEKPIHGLTVETDDEVQVMIELDDHSKKLTISIGVYTADGQSRGLYVSGLSGADLRWIKDLVEMRLVELSKESRR